MRRSDADPLAWLAVAGVLAMVAFALTWLSVALGLVTVGANAVVATAWCAGIALVGYLWAKRLYRRDAAR